MLAKRDLAVMLLSAFAVYYSLQHDGVITFNRSWHLPTDDGVGDRGDPVTHRGIDDHPPVPVFFDLNGDGEKEIIVASRGPEIRIVAPPNGGGGGGGSGGGGSKGNSPGNGAPSASEGDVFAAVKTMVGRRAERQRSGGALSERVSFSFLVSFFLLEKLKGYTRAKNK